MDKNYYIFKSGTLKRKGNTLYFVYTDEEGKEISRSIPVNAIHAIYAFGEIGFNTKALNFLASSKIPVHLFNYYGFYTGTFWPIKPLVSGFLLVQQVQVYLNKEDRIVLAKEFVLGAIHNTVKNLIHYEKQKKEVTETINALKSLQAKIHNVETILELMALEGNAKDLYYRSFGKFLAPEFEMKNRVKRPPDNMINSLISYGNSLLYTTVLSEIFHTQLDPTISYLHEPGDRRFSLSLDIAEIFKPIIVDKIIFKLINNNMIKEKHFLKELNYVYLNEAGKRIFIEEYQARLEQTINHQRLKRHISYKTLIRFECYKIIKHLVKDEQFSSFKMYW